MSYFEPTLSDIISFHTIIIGIFFGAFIPSYGVLHFSHELVWIQIMLIIWSYFDSMQSCITTVSLVPQTAVKLQ